MPSTPIANCPVEFRFQCPKLWENLDPTDDRRIRFCETCQKQVHLCENMEEVARHAHAGNCIAIKLPHRKEQYVGDMGPPTYSQ